MSEIPDFEQVFIVRKGSIGEYVYDDCPSCAARGEKSPHQILVCRNCGAQPNGTV